MNHIIKVTVNQDTVTADPNPAPKTGYMVKPGDLVYWSHDPTMELQVVFSKYADLPLGQVPDLKDLNPYGPFSNLTVVVGAGLIFGTIRSDVPTAATNRRYFYKIFRDGKTLKWDPRVGGAPDLELGGGIDIPMTPGPGAT